MDRLEELQKLLQAELVKPIPPRFDWEERQDVLSRQEFARELLEKFFNGV